MRCVSTNDRITWRRIACISLLVHLLTRQSFMASYTLPFEKPVVELEAKLKELMAFSDTQKIDVSHEIERMKKKISELRKKIYSELTPWQKVQVARHRHPVQGSPRAREHQFGAVRLAQRAVRQRRRAAGRAGKGSDGHAPEVRQGADAGP